MFKQNIQKYEMYDDWRRLCDGDDGMAPLTCGTCVYIGQHGSVKSCRLQSKKCTFLDFIHQQTEWTIST